MYLQQECETIVSLLKAEDALSNCYIFLAHPYAQLPTKGSGPVIAVMPHTLEAKRSGIGEETYGGSYAVQADLYVPQRLGSPMLFTTAEQVTRALLSLYPTGIRLGSIESAHAPEYFKMQCVFTFDSAFEAGGEVDG